MSEKVKLQEAVAVVDQALSEYVEDLKYLQKNGDEDARFDEDVKLLRKAWAQVKTKVEEESVKQLTLKRSKTYRKRRVKMGEEFDEELGALLRKESEDE